MKNNQRRVKPNVTLDPVHYKNFVEQCHRLRLNASRELDRLIINWLKENQDEHSQ